MENATTATRLHVIVMLPSWDDLMRVYNAHEQPARLASLIAVGILERYPSGNVPWTVELELLKGNPSKWKSVIDTFEA